LATTGVLLLLATARGAAAPGGKKGNATPVTIDEMKFNPPSVQVNVGDTVEWTNNDVRDHTVVARDGSFNSGNLSKGDTFRYTFKKAGSFAYACSLHPRMKGTVVVTAPKGPSKDSSKD
jgi:plastocyanin